MNGHVHAKDLSYDLGAKIPLTEPITLRANSFETFRAEVH